jgi:hypothetical protein
MKYKQKILIGILNLSCLAARSPHRITPPNMPIPTITVSNPTGTEIYTTQHPHLEEYPFFGTYDEPFLMKHQLPPDDIAYKNDPKKKISGAVLSQELTQLVHEIKNNSKKFSSFKILQKKNFNHPMHCGLLVLKHKKHPFVVKLFMEHPKSFVHPTWKGFDPIFFFYMSGGTNRHIAGFTRIKNREHIAQWALHNQEWGSIVELPRKWFWLPPSPDWIHITGTNIGDKAEQTTTIPGTYAIVADYFPPEKKRSIVKHRQELIMKLCNDLALYIDPHDSNYIVSKDSHTKKLKIAIIDTEHFPTMVGFDKKMRFANHTEWLLHLAGKCVFDIYFRTKSTRRKIQMRERNFYV